jgi:hypothetical protein
VSASSPRFAGLLPGANCGRRIEPHRIVVTARHVLPPRTCSPSSPLSSEAGMLRRQRQRINIQWHARAARMHGYAWATVCAGLRPKGCPQCLRPPPSRCPAVVWLFSAEPPTAVAPPPPPAHSSNSMRRRPCGRITAWGAYSPPSSIEAAISSSVSPWSSICPPPRPHHPSEAAVRCSACRFCAGFL